MLKTPHEVFDQFDLDFSGQGSTMELAVQLTTLAGLVCSVLEGLQNNRGTCAHRGATKRPEFWSFRAGTWKMQPTVMKGLLR